MKRCLFPLVVILSACDDGKTIQPSDVSSVSENKMLTSKKFPDDSADFGCGMQTFSTEYLSKDTMFSYDRFVSSNVKFVEVGINEDEFEWNGFTVCQSNDRLRIKSGTKSRDICEIEGLLPNDAYEVHISGSKFLAVFLFPVNLCSHLVWQPVVLIDKAGNLVRKIDDEGRFSASPTCFCDIDKDGYLDYIMLDQVNNRVEFYDVICWKRKPKAGFGIEMTDWADAEIFYRIVD